MALLCKTRREMQHCKLLRVLTSTTFCVMYCKTRAVLCVECDPVDASLFSRMTSASPFYPMDVRVKLGDYHVDTGVFKKSEIVLSDTDKKISKGTRYRKICI